MRNIIEGNKVVVTWDGNEGTVQMEGIVQNTPSDVGDFWYLLDKNGKTHAINPMCSTLVSIVKLEE
jgi:hypothetical protein